MSTSQISYQEVLISSLGGMGRGIFVNSLISPLEVIKTTQQSQAHAEQNYKIAMRLFKQEGASVFYRGLFPQLIKTSMKQIWSWPIITSLPKILREKNVSPAYQSAITGLTIATVDAVLTTPIEQARVNAIVNNTKINLRSLYAEWNGLGTHLAKQSMSWTTFLFAQDHFRKKAHEATNSDRLTFGQLISVSLRVSLVVSFVTAPFDLANTLKQTNNLRFSNFFSTTSALKMGNCLPLTAGMLWIHNLASIALLEYLENK